MLSFSSYFSPGYLALYLPAAVLLYALAGQRGRRAVLLLFSYVCFWAVSGKLIAYLLLSTLSMYHTGLWLAHDQARTKELLEETPKEERRALRARAQTKQRRILALGLLFQLGMLVVLKYTPFFLSNYNALLQALHADPASTLYVGDSNVDVETAHNANLPCCGAVWGFRTREELNAAGAEYLAENSDELYDVITK